MKKKEFNLELDTLSKEQLEEKLEQLRQDLFSLRLNAQTAHVKDHAQFGLLRKNIARVLTRINQTQMQAEQAK